MTQNFSSVFMNRGSSVGTHNGQYFLKLSYALMRGDVLHITFLSNLFSSVEFMTSCAMREYWNLAALTMFHLSL